MVKRISILTLLFLIYITGWAHQMPNSVLLLNVKSDGIQAELQLPLKELQLAFAGDVTNNTNTLVPRLGKDIAAYIIAHTHPVSPDGTKWTVGVTGFSMDSAEQTATGPYQELKIFLWLQAPSNESAREVTLYYDGIVHQVVTHKILVAVKRDWESGKLDSSQSEIGVIKLDVRNNMIPPLIINLDKGSTWIGFKSMFDLGANHIAEGTDHLLFLLVLLLPATLIASNGRWTSFGGVNYSIIKLLKIITAFTIGHSISLLLASLHILILPQRPVEIAIAFTILITAIHAIRPIFAGKEV